MFLQATLPRERLPQCYVLTEAEGGPVNHFISSMISRPHFSISLSQTISSNFTRFVPQVSQGNKGANSELLHSLYS
jgi:hypothetical protein